MALKEVTEISEKAKKYLGLTEKYISTIRSLKELIAIDRVVKRALEAVLSCDDALEIVKRTGLSVEKIEQLFSEWLELMFSGSYDYDHSARVFKIGLAHTRAGVPEKLMVLQMGVFADAIIREALENGASPDQVLAITKSLFWNLALMLHSYHVARRKSIEKTTGISPELLDRLVSVSAEEICKELVSSLSIKTPQINT